MSAATDRALTVLHRAVELGVDHVDTAAWYRAPGGIGDGEENLRRLGRDRLDVVNLRIVKKAGQVRLAWTLHQGPHVLAIPATGDPDHVDDNVAAGALRLTDEELALLA